MTGSPTEPDRLRHGYTNATVVAGRSVVKRYLGPDAPVRRGREIKALRLLAGRFPVPPLIEYDDSQVVLAFVPACPVRSFWRSGPVRCCSRWAGRAAHCMS